MAVTLAAEVLDRFPRFSLFNSPYVAHASGRAIDLYPPPDAGTVPSPVAGEVMDVHTVEAPPNPYAADTDQLVLVDTGDHVARLLHVDAAVEPGERVAVGTPLGRPIRAGFFAPWVPSHVHVEFRSPSADLYRATGSVRLEVDAQVRGLEWDGTGTVVAAGETWARLDAPGHPAPGEYYVGLGAGGGVLDGGLPHYDVGGVLDGTGSPRLLGARLGDREGRLIEWADLTVRANDTPVTGIACRCAREQFGVKLVGRDIALAPGESVTVTIERT